MTLTSIDASAPLLGASDTAGAHRAADGVFGQVTAGEGLDTPRRPGPSERLGVRPDRWEAILRCLGTECTDEVELEEARQRVASAVEAFAHAVRIDARHGVEPPG